MKPSLSSIVLSAFIVMLATTSASFGAVILASGAINNAGDTETVVFSSAAVANRVNAELGVDEILFLGNEELRVKGNKKAHKKAHKALVTAADKKFDYIEWQLNSGEGMDLLQFNLKAKVKNKAGGTAQITLVNQFGVAHTYELALSKGNNVFSLEAMDGDVIVKAFIEADEGVLFKHLKQVQVRTAAIPVVVGTGLLGEVGTDDLIDDDWEDDGELPEKPNDDPVNDGPVPVPEPSTLVLVGLGGLFLALAGRRR